MPSYTVQADWGTVRVHGELGEHCADCLDVASHLCDYPIGGDKTCDRNICEQHGTVVGYNTHYCLNHFREWMANNPDKEEYRYTHLHLSILPGMAETALGFLKEAFDLRDPGDRGPQLQPFLRNSAIPLGRDAMRAALGGIQDAPHTSLAGGLGWGIEHGLVEVCWRKLHGSSPQPFFALTLRGLAVLEGEEVELRD